MPLDTVLLFLRIAIALALYAFLGVLFLLLWRDLRAAAQMTREMQRVPGKLVVISCEEVLLEVGREFPMQPVTTLGRGPTNTIVIPDSFASTDHVHITWRQGRWWLDDQHSRNGTTLNDIAVTEPVVLASGDEIGVGRVRFRLEMD